MNEKREPLRFVQGLRICFNLLHSKTEIDATEVPLISPLIRIASVAVFSISFYAALFVIRRNVYELGNIDFGYLGIIGLWELYGVCSMFVVAYTLEAVMLRFRAMVVKFLLRRKDVAFSQIIPLVVPYSFLIWIAYTVIVLAMIFSGSNWLGYVLLLLLQLPIMGTIVRLAQAAFGMDKKDVIRLGVAYFLIMHTITVLLFNGLEHLIYILS